MLPPTLPPTLQPQSAFRVVGYVSDWGSQVTPDQIGKLTHLNYAFAVPHPDGTLQPPANESRLQIPTIRAKTQIAHKRAGGIMIWTINDDAPGDASLLNAIIETVK